MDMDKYNKLAEKYEHELPKIDWDAKGVLEREDISFVPMNKSIADAVTARAIAQRISTSDYVSKILQEAILAS